MIFNIILTILLFMLLIVDIYFTFEVISIKAYLLAVLLIVEDVLIGVLFSLMLNSVLHTILLY
jgi:hypothetical protein